MLMGGLQEEKVRWTLQSSALQSSRERLVGDALLAAGTTCYLGAFPWKMRNELTWYWCEACDVAEVHRTRFESDILHQLKSEALSQKRRHGTASDGTSDNPKPPSHGAPASGAGAGRPGRRLKAMGSSRRGL